MAQRVGETLSQSLVVENRPGAGGNLAAMHVARGVQADGYTLLQANSGMVTINPFIYRSGVPDYVRELTPIAGMTDSPQAVLVPASLGVKTLQEFVALARAPKEPMNFASGGIGTLAHVSFELFKKAENLRMEHIPYKGTGPAIQDMLAGRVHLMIDNVSQVKGHIESGAIRVLAMTGPRRLPLLPDTPTSAEAGFPRLQAIGWQALYAPAKTPPDVVEKLRAAARQVLDTGEWSAQMGRQGAVGRWISADEISDRTRRESAVWSDVIRSANITAE
jgi:tripartite-type tricarboxylate transporter receptor subunit TctC